MAKLNVYLLFPNSNIESVIEVTGGQKLIEDVSMLIDRIDCEKDSKLYYEDANLESFFEELKTLEAFEEIGDFGVVDFETGLYYLLREANAENVEHNPKHDDNCHYIRWDLDNQSATNESFSVLKAMIEKILATIVRGEKEITEKLLTLIQNEDTPIAERIKNKLPRKEKSILLNVNNAISTSRRFIALFKDCRANPNREFPAFAHLYFVSDFAKLEQWFNDNRQQRNYNVETRHIEGHPNYRRGKSPILGGIGGTEHIASLLKNAIGDWKTHKLLFNFDTENNCYVRFEFENDNPQNQYHGYHLVKPITHEIDAKAVGEIPSRVISILEYRKRFVSN
ncbi:MAG: hypothetical protein ACPGVB_05125 [Chitinophagales bacterium]